MKTEIIKIVDNQETINMAKKNKFITCECGKVCEIPPSDYNEDCPKCPITYYAYCSVCDDYIYED